jgi:hypothetical protein
LKAILVVEGIDFPKTHDLEARRAMLLHWRAECEGKFGAARKALRKRKN